MTARTVTEYRALAQAGERGLAHVAMRRDTGSWFSRCGRQIRGKDIRSWTGEQAAAHAATLGDTFCEECRQDAIRIAGTVAEGVAILLALDLADDSTLQLLEVPVDAIASTGGRPAGEDLVASVQANGVMTPVLARRTATGLVLVAGTRRLAAARVAGFDTIPTVIVGYDEDRAVVASLLENLHRQDLDPIAQALAFQDAIDRLGVSQTQLADGLGVSRPHVCNTLRLLALPEYLQEEVANGNLTAQQGRALLRIEDETERAEIAAHVVAAHLTGAETDAVVRARVRREQERQHPELAAIADLLAGVLAAKVKVARAGDRARVTLDVPDKDLARLLEQLGAHLTVAA